MRPQKTVFCGLDMRRNKSDSVQKQQKVKKDVNEPVHYNHRNNSIHMCNNDSQYRVKQQLLPTHKSLHHKRKASTVCTVVNIAIALIRFPSNYKCNIHLNAVWCIVDCAQH